MLKLPITLVQQFDNLLLNKSLSDKDRAFYKKWLRFYWDFCHKYQHDVFHVSSLPLFIQKLQDKRQSVQQQNQAKHAVSIFYELRSSSKQPLTRNNRFSNQPEKNVTPDKIALSHGN